jgi:hypothetical protein
MRFKERRSDAFSVKDETKVAIGDEWQGQGQDSAVILLLISDEFYTIAPSLTSTPLAGADTSRESRAI